MGCIWNLKLSSDKMSQQPFHQNYQKTLKSVFVFKSKRLYFYSSTESRNSSAALACQFIQRGYLLIHWYPIASTNKDTVLHIALHSSLFTPLPTAALGAELFIWTSSLFHVTHAVNVGIGWKGSSEYLLLLPSLYLLHFIFTPSESNQDQ